MNGMGEDEVGLSFPISPGHQPLMTGPLNRAEACPNAGASHGQGAGDVSISIISTGSLGGSTHTRGDAHPVVA